MTPLADRVRATLPAAREVSMFGSLSFLVNEKIVVAVRGDGGLLVRADPDRNRELTALPGAEQAEMGAGRVMGRGWISVAGDAVATDEQLSFWIDVALDHNAR